jgi:LacI family repressor for deo operon, udp, cdd, tsx, nupC, and nupG
MIAVSRPVMHDEVAYIGVDDVDASKTATEYLLSLGHSRIVFVSGPLGDAVSELRYRGYAAAITGALDEKAIWQVEGDGTSEGGRSAVERLFIRDSLPTAFFCYNDSSAIGVISSLQSRGYQVPRDFSVIGFDDIPFARNMSPSLTTIRQPRGQIGELAMSNLLDMLSSRKAPTAKTLLHGDLIVRDSCSTPKK